MKLTIALIFAALILGGCMHTVSFDNKGGAIWTATPHPSDVK